MIGLRHCIENSINSTPSLLHVSVLKTLPILNSHLQTKHYEIIYLWFVMQLLSDPIQLGCLIFQEKILYIKFFTCKSLFWSGSQGSTWTGTDIE